MERTLNNKRYIKWLQQKDIEVPIGSTNSEAFDIYIISLIDKDILQEAFDVDKQYNERSVNVIIDANKEYRARVCRIQDSYGNILDMCMNCPICNNVAMLKCHEIHKSDELFKIRRLALETDIENAGISEISKEINKSIMNKISKLHLKEIKRNKT